MDNKKQAEELKTIFTMAKNLIRISEQKYFKRIVTPPNRLVIVESDFDASSWWLSNDIKNRRNQKPSEYGIFALKDALKWIDEFKTQPRESTVY